MKILSNEDYASMQTRCDDYEALAVDYHSLERENMELRLELKIRQQNDITRHRMDENFISRSQHMTEYKRPDGLTVREVSYSHKSIVAQPRAEPSASLVKYAKEESLVEWLEKFAVPSRNEKSPLGRVSLVENFRKVSTSIIP